MFFLHFGNIIDNRAYQPNKAIGLFTAFVYNKCYV